MPSPLGWIDTSKSNGRSTRLCRRRSASDAEFLRASISTSPARIPHNAAVRKFLEDKSPDKRRKLVEELLDSSLYVTNFTNTWRAVMLPQNNNVQVQFAPQMEAWLRQRIRANVPYDQMVRDLLTAAPSYQGGSGPRIDPNATAFYQANELKPENLAAASSRLFLGVKLECAQCHNHPFAKWTREQFWELLRSSPALLPSKPSARTACSPATAAAR